ncbi:MAG: hypothetical protein OXI87_00690 [Albidovulum sp.]|nr:hypothetical protein [Albidovulum sp.]MDE0303390.1 hypothetical protein [Albidovulum sp.]
MTRKMYEDGMEARLRNLCERAHSGMYRVVPFRRVDLPEPGGGTRPLGIAA